MMQAEFRQVRKESGGQMAVVSMSWALKVEAEARKAVEGAVRNKSRECLPFTKSLNTWSMSRRVLFGVNGKHLCTKKHRLGGKTGYLSTEL